MKSMINNPKLLALAALLVVAIATNNVDAQTICNMSVSDLMTCKPSVTPPNPTQPTPTCCSALSHADMHCLCGYKNSKVLPSLGIDPNLAMQLPRGYGVATGGPTAWGLCYNREMSPSQSYCDESYKIDYPCAPGAEYYGRGALPIYWNYNYGATGQVLNVDLLNHPEYIEQNATLAFMAAMWKWMTPIKKNQPSAHDIFVGNWKPTKNDTLAKRGPNFGTTMNILYGDYICGQGDIDPMNNIITHYLYYLDLMVVGREEAGPHENLTCT